MQSELVARQAKAIKEKSLDTLILEARVIALLMRHDQLGTSADVRIKEIEMFVGYPYFEKLFWELDKIQVAYLGDASEEGFAPIFECGVYKGAKEYLEMVLSAIDERVKLLQQQITDAFTFNPEKLNSQVLETREKIAEVKAKISGNDLLKPLEAPINQIERHFIGISAISQNYSEIHKNIVRPIQKEFEESAKATVRWAIYSLAASTLVSIILGNWSEIRDLVVRLSTGF